MIPHKFQWTRKLIKKMFVFNHKPRIWGCIYRTTFWVFFLKSIPLLSLTTGIAAWSKMEFLRYSVRRWIQYDRRIILLHIDSKYYFLCQWTPPSSCYGKFIRISPEIFRHTGGTPHTPYPPFSYPTVHSIPAPCPLPPALIPIISHFILIFLEVPFLIKRCVSP